MLALALHASLALFAGPISAAVPSRVETRIQKRIASFRGEMGLYARNLETGEVLAVNADARFPTASVIKLAVMAEVERRLAEGTLDLGTTVTLREEDKAGDETTPREAAELMARISDGRIGGKAAAEEMVAILATQQDRAMIPRSLPVSRPGVLVANKTGWDEEKRPDARGFRGDVRGDVAFVRGPRGRYVIAVLARRIADKSTGPDSEALRTGAALSRIVWDAFQEGRAPR